MAIAKIWNSVIEFSASDAAYLIMGLEPELATKETLPNHKFLIREMHKCYLDTCAHVRFCVERTLPPYDTPLWFSDEDLSDAEVLLPSLQMAQLINMFETAKTVGELIHQRRYFLYWLESSIDSFHDQRFLGLHISNWLDWQSFESEFRFFDDEQETPQSRRESIKRLMIECGGNKSEVARQLGISRQRINQLLASNTKVTSKPLQFGAQDPFGLARAPEGYGEE